MSQTLTPSDARNVPYDIPEAMSASTLANFPVSLCLTDSSLADNPIVYVNAEFCRTTKYRYGEVVGRNCRFLQGQGTDPDAVRQLREGIAAGQRVTVEILNYRKTGEPFKNRLMVFPLPEVKGPSRYFLGMQAEVSDDTSTLDQLRAYDERFRELQHSVKNHLSILLGSLRRDVSQMGSKQALDRTEDRLETVRTLYDEFSAQSRTKPPELIHLGSYLSRVASANHALDSRDTIRLHMRFDEILVDMRLCARIGLFMSEAMSNIYQHAFANDETGAIEIDLTVGKNYARLSISDNGEGVEPIEISESGGLGEQILRDLAKRVGGTVSIDFTDVGTVVSLEFALPDVG